MPSFKTLDDLDVKGKRVLLRTDLNVPAKDGIVTDETRLIKASRTIKELVSKGAKVVIISHFGRPKGRDESCSLKFLIGNLSRAIGQEIFFVDDVISEEARQASHRLKEGQVLLIENVRFYPEEELNTHLFTEFLSKLGDVYVNDALSASHRVHASIAGITHFLPSYAGRLMQSELEALEQALDHPQKPVAALVGGAKISTKLALLGNLVSKVDYLVIGGGMANTFLFAQGYPVGLSLCEKDMAPTALSILEKAKTQQCQVILPKDLVVATEFKAHAPHKIVTLNEVPADHMILDAGPDSVQEIIKLMKKWKTLVWNGPLGAFEIEPFDQATNAVAKAAAEATELGKILTVAGGGDTVSALAHAGVEDKFSYVSTAGGAFLEWLEGKDLPGVTALKESH
jgi:phosphoglycerate kinase